MPLYEDSKYHPLFIGDMHPVKLMDGNKVVFEPNVSELSGEIISVAKTYNDNAYIKIFGKTVEIGEGEKSPDNPYELKSVGDDGGFDLVSCGRNIWDGSLIEGHVRPTDGEELSWEGFYKTDFIPVPPDTDYAITYTKPSSGTTFWAIYYDINKNYISSQNLAPFTPPFSIKTPIGTTYLRITGATSSMTTLTQIELGSSATPYEPFRGMQTINFPYTLRSLPDGTCDYILIDNVQKRAWYYQLTGEKVLDGTESWQKYKELLWTENKIGVALYSITPTATVSTGELCTHFRRALVTGDSGFVATANGFRATSSGFYFAITISGITDIESWQSFLAAQHAAGTPVTVQYKLANPPEPIELDYNEIKTFYPFTQIYTTATVQPTLDGKFRVWGS